MSKELKETNEEKKIEEKKVEEKNTINNTDAKPASNKNDDDGEANKTDSKNTEDLVSKTEVDKLYARLMKENEKKEDIKSKLDEALGQLNSYKEAEEQKERDRLKRKEDYEKLSQKYESDLTEYKTLKEQLEAENNQLQAALSVTYESMLEEIPEERQSLIPENFTISQKIEYLTKNKNLLIPEKKIVSQPPSPKGNNQEHLDEREQLEARLQELQAKKRRGEISHQESRELWDITKKISVANIKIQTS